MRKYLRASLVAGVVAFALWGCGQDSNSVSSQIPSQMPTQVGLPDFADLVEHSAPAVVNISTTLKAGVAKLDENAAQSSAQNPLADGSPLAELFKFFLGIPNDGQDDEESDQQAPPEGALGSGFILDREGYILTNRHVIADAAQIVVRLSDRRELIARVIGEDAASDLALLQVQTKGLTSELPALKLGDSDALRVGSWVLAIGSPFGFDHSVTAGIVSAKGRGIPDDKNQSYVPFIQTDVAINPGNSGGPLLNMRGEVVGINSQIYTESGGYMGLSFAIPINMAMDVVAQLKQQGHVSRGYLGVQIQDVDRDLAEAFGLDRPKGALVVHVAAGSPADVAGVQVGDVVLEVEGVRLSDADSLPMQIGSLPPGKDARLTVMRNRDVVHLRVKLVERPDAAKVEPQIAPQDTPLMPSRAPARRLLSKALV